MAILGTLLKNKRAGDTKLAWNLPALAGPETLVLESTAFAHDGGIPKLHAGKLVGGKDRSPALAWTGVPEGTAQLLLVVEDVDAPTRSPAVHCVALIDPALEGLPEGALTAKSPAAGTRPLRSQIGRGYHGPGPIKGHGPHRYVFQLFALGKTITETADGGALDKAKPRAVIASATGEVLARARLDGLYER